MPKKAARKIGLPVIFEKYGSTELPRSVDKPCEKVKRNVVIPSQGNKVVHRKLALTTLVSTVVSLVQSKQRSYLCLRLFIVLANIPQSLVKVHNLLHSAPYKAAFFVQ